MFKLFDEIKTVLESICNNNQIKKYFSSNNELLRSKVDEDARKNDSELISALFNNKKCKDAFFEEISINNGVITIFSKDKFCQVINNHSFLPNSFTAFENKIGLTVNGNYLSRNNDVVLSFPHKDCVLEGGQTKEDQKRDEVFYNEILAHDEITTMLEPKCFANVKRYDKEHFDGETINEFQNDNLIIKGNNLIALSSILKRYEGKVKLIYIDPPFNTGKDDFGYNDRFNHSSWLTFMMNRIEIAKRLLKDDGIFVVHVGNEEASYIQVLLDEIFSRENYLNHITMTTNAPSGFKATSGKIFSTSNHIFIYSKNINNVTLNKQFVKKGYDNAYKYILKNPEENYSKWQFETYYEMFAKQQGYSSFKEMKENVEDQELEIQLLKFLDFNKNRVFRTAAISGGALKKREITVKNSKVQKNVVLKHPNDDIENFYILNGEMIVFWENTYKYIDGKMQPAMALTDVWTDVGFTGIANEGNVTLKNGKKPEKLLKRIIELSTTSENDIVLDFHLGSGTTCAVAHKMGRKYIGIEQMDYIENLAITRLKNVINGDKSGISKDVNWQGGGSFVYCELAKFNQEWIDQIENASTEAELNDIYKKIQSINGINAYLDPSVLNEETGEFEKLAIEDKKKILIKIIDKNTLYYNFSEIDDDNTNISSSDKEFTKSFYGD